MLTLSEAFSHIKSIKALVIGDFLLDVYTKGSVDRISPEAPVQVLLVSQINQLPGGAGNVALNLRALGADVAVIGRIGDDESGKKLISFLKEEEINIDALYVQDLYKTPLKNRFLANGQQLMRTDYEEILPISDRLEKMIEDYVLGHLSEFDVVAISDYGKGFLTKKLLKTILTQGQKLRIPVIIDPKGKDFTKYDGAYLIKPNNKEAYIAASCDVSVPIEKVGAKILSEVKTDYLLITRSDKGMILFSENEVQNFEGVKKDVVDVTGAGDTALAMITFGVGNKLCFSHTITLANIAASLAVDKVGCVAIKLTDVASKLLEQEPSTKIIWDDTNLFVLDKVLKDEILLFLDLKEESDLSVKIYHTIKQAYEKKNGAKLIAILSPTSNKDFIYFLASMHEIDFVFARSDELKYRFIKDLVLTTN